MFWRTRALRPRRSRRRRNTSTRTTRCIITSVADTAQGPGQGSALHPAAGLLQSKCSSGNSSTCQPMDHAAVRPGWHRILRTCLVVSPQDDEFRDFIVDDEVPDGQQRAPRRRLARKDPHLGHISNAALRVRRTPRDVGTLKLIRLHAGCFSGNGCHGTVHRQLFPAFNAHLWCPPLPVQLAL